MTTAWETVAPLPMPLVSPAVLTWNGKLYAFGAKNHPRALYVYDPVADSWDIRKMMPSPGVYNPFSAHGPGKLIVAGGINPDTNKVSKETWRYDDDRDNWTQMRDMPAARHNNGASMSCGLSGKLYVIGGANTTTPTTGRAEVFSYDISRNRWDQRKSMPKARYGHAVGHSKGLFYIVGGQTGDGDPAYMRVYDPKKNTWSTREAPPFTSDVTVGTVGRSKILVTCAGSTLADNEATEVYFIDETTWAGISTTGHDGRVKAGSERVGDYFYLVGGVDTGGAALDSVIRLDAPDTVDPDYPTGQIWPRCDERSGHWEDVVTTLPGVVDDAFDRADGELYLSKTTSGHTWPDMTSYGMLKHEVRDGAAIIQGSNANNWVNFAWDRAKKDYWSWKTSLSIEVTAQYDPTVGVQTGTYDVASGLGLVPCRTSGHGVFWMVRPGGTSDSPPGRVYYYCYVDNSKDLSSIASVGSGAMPGSFGIISDKRTYKATYDTETGVTELLADGVVLASYTISAASRDAIKADGPAGSHLAVRGGSGLASSQISIWQIDDVITRAEGTDRTPIWETKSGNPYGNRVGVNQLVGSKIYVLGGFASSDTKVSYAYDFAGDTWTSLNPAAIYTRDLMSGTVGGKIYVIDQDANATFYCYDPATDTWTTKAPAPAHHIAYNFADTNGELNGKLYFAGGYSNTYGIITALSCYDPVSNSWSTKAPMPSGRSRHSFKALDGKLYAVGGFDSNQAATNTVFCYDPATNAWTTKAPIPVSIYEHSCAAYNGKLYVWGGFQGSPGTPQTGWVYDPIADSWSQESRLLPVGRTNTPAVSNSDAIFLMPGGGATAGTASNSVLKLAMNTTISPTSVTSEDQQWVSDQTDGQLWPRQSPQIEAGHYVDIVETAPVDTTPTNLGGTPLSPTVNSGGNQSAYRDVVTFNADVTLNSVQMGMTAQATGTATLNVYQSADGSGTPIATTSSPQANTTGNLLTFNFATPLALKADTQYSFVWSVTTAVLSVCSNSPTTGAVKTIIGYYPGGTPWPQDNNNYRSLFVANGYYTNGAPPAPEGTSWTPLATGLSGYARYQARMVGDEYYVAGEFKQNIAGGTYAYNTLTNSWSAIAAKPDHPDAAMSTASGVIDGKLYTVGGQTYSGTLLSTTAVYDPKTNAWTKKASRPLTAQGPAGDVISGKLYVCGGKTASAVSNALHEYDPVADSWSTKAPMPVSLYGHGAASLDGKLYVYGGNDGTASQLGLMVYDPAQNSWSTLAPCPLTGPYNWPLFMAAGYRLYASAGVYPNVQWARYDPDTDSWDTTLLQLPTGESTPYAAAKGSDIYMVGDSGRTYVFKASDFTPTTPPAAPGTISFRDKSTYFLGTADTVGPAYVDMTIPSTVQEGDLLLMIIGTDGSDTRINDSSTINQNLSGWVLESFATGQGNSGSLAQLIFSRVAQAGDAGSVARWNCSKSGTASARVNIGLLAYANAKLKSVTVDPKYDSYPAQPVSENAPAVSADPTDWVLVAGLAYTSATTPWSPMTPPGVIRVQTPSDNVWVSIGVGDGPESTLGSGPYAVTGPQRSLFVPQQFMTSSIVLAAGAADQIWVSDGPAGMIWP